MSDHFETLSIKELGLYPKAVGKGLRLKFMHNTSSWFIELDATKSESDRK